MPKETITGRIERFGDLPDSRIEGRTDHDLLDMIVFALCAVMSGAEGWDDIVDWGLAREEWPRRYNDNPLSPAQNRWVGLSGRTGDRRADEWALTW